MELGIKLPEILKSEKNPAVSALLDKINELVDIIQKQTKEIRQLKDEIARLKGGNPRPKIKPSKMEENTEIDSSKKSNRKKSGNGKRKKKKNLEIHEKIFLRPDNIPKGSKLLKYKDYTVQGIIIKPNNILYKRGIWRTPSGEILKAKLPSDIKGHFDYKLKCFILYQYYHLHVTEPLILDYLLKLGFDISCGQINNILIEDKEMFHDETEKILEIGLLVSKFVQTDDTGARHKGQNSYCTYIGNDFFSYFKTTKSKSRINFLELLRGQKTDYVLNYYALTYIKNQGFKETKFVLLDRSKGKVFSDTEDWQDFLKRIGISSKKQIKTATEGALLGGIVSHGIRRDLVIHSDDAGQFNIFIHCLCWIHAERKITGLIPINDEQASLTDFILQRFWNIYRDLKLYKENPGKEKIIGLEKRFDNIFTTETGFELLDKALLLLHKNKTELLVVLDRPFVPLHNNASENEIRDEVKKRKISAGTRSDAGRKCRNTFLSLKKTCKKLGVPFFDYLHDRISGLNKIPSLSEIIRERAQAET